MASSEFGHRPAVIKRAIALVFFPVVLGKFFVVLQHKIIAVGFCQDAGGCDRIILAITFDDGGMRNFFVRLEPVAIDDDERWFFFQLIQGQVHGLDGGIEDVDFINFWGINFGYSPADRNLLDHVPQGITRFFLDLF